MQEYTRDSIEGIKALLLIIVIVFLFVKLFVPFYDLAQEITASLKAIAKGEIFVISSVTYPAPRGRPHYVMIEGTDILGNKKVVWLDTFKRFFNPEIVLVIYLDKGIDKEEALSIIKNNNLFNIEEITEMFLLCKAVYADSADIPRKPSRYKAEWYICAGEIHKVLSIDFETGKYKLLNTDTGEVEKTNY